MVPAPKGFCITTLEKSVIERELDFDLNTAVLTDPGTLGPRGINNLSPCEVTGSDSGTAYLYPGSFPLISLDPMVSANSINNAGQIVGDGTHNGKARAFLLTPQ